MKKLPHTISTEELLASINNNSKEATIPGTISSDPILSFLQAFNLETGHYYISNRLLYTLFKQWDPKIKIPSKSFDKQINKYIEYDGKSDNKYFHLNISPIKIGQIIEDYVENRSRTAIKSKTYKKRFEDFLKAHELEEGDLYVEVDILYYLYDTWMYKNHKDKAPLGTGSFDALCQIYFDVKYLAHSKFLWLGVSRNIEKYLKKEEVENWRIGRVKYAKKIRADYTPMYSKEEEVLYKETINRFKNKKA